MGIAEEALEFTSLLKEQYFIKRDMASLSRLMSEQVSWIGTGKGEMNRSLSEACRALAQESAEYGGAFSVAETSLEAVALDSAFCLVYGTVRAVPEDPALAEENLRLTAVLERTATEMKLLHLHFSHADEAQAEGRYFVPRTEREEAKALRHSLRARRQQLENLTQNIPGGAHQCENDPYFTLISMSESFLSMFGYSREEIATLFENRFINMIYPDDREEMARAAREQLKNGKEIELEYRVLRKGKSPIWILDKGRLLDGGDGHECFYCLLIEITDRKRAQEALRLSLERHQVIMDQTTDIIFEWDILKDTLTFSANWRKKFGYDPICQSISGQIPLSQNIHPEDMQAFVKIMRETAAGVPYSETEFRIKNHSEKHLWCRIRATTQYGADQRPIKAVGVIIDIDQEKKQKQALLEQARRDALTGLYNKAAINSLVEQRMRESGACGSQALLVIDVDHFKAVNDTYGHLRGDSLLSDVAAAIKSSVRMSDLAGRIGGDEFLVYLPDVADEAAARTKAEAILSALQVLSPSRGAPPISCSIGGAVFPRGSVDYYHLYKCADEALYYQKNNGRGGVSFYQEGLDCEKAPCAPPASAVNAVIGSDDGNVADEQLAQYVFRTLYEAKELEPTLNLLLEIIGRSYDVSRAYLFESSKDGRRASITFEWCSEGVNSQMAVLQDLSYEEDLGNYQENFDPEGVFYCHDIEALNPGLREILRPQGISSMLQCAILDDGKFWGGVGFDECRENRVWSSGQIASFKLTAHVLASFLLKLRMKQELQRFAEKGGEGEANG